ncbi:MAG: thiamine pyrophosphate-dependent enzyme [Candidatus Heimdallarchaeota archaeon]
MKGYEVITALKDLISDNEIIVSSNGNISREAFNLLPQPQVYLRGSMGLPVPIGLGLALANPDKQVIVITGDGNFLMGFNSSVTTAFYKPNNLKILILDNNKYFTTGGQETVSSALDYPSFLNSLNIDYKKSKQAIADEIKKDLTEFLISKSFSILHLLIEAGRLQIENIPWHPEEITEKIVTRLTK